jgi:hypothetical protein
MADNCVTHHPVQLAGRIGSSENRLAESLCRLAALGRLVHEKDGFAHHVPLTRIAP